MRTFMWIRAAGRLLSLLLACLVTTPCWATPDQTVVIANQNVPESLTLAGHYLKVLGIPQQQLCLLDLPVDAVRVHQR